MVSKRNFSGGLKVLNDLMNVMINFLEFVICICILVFFSFNYFCYVYIGDVNLSMLIILKSDVMDGVF